jgi:iron complex outermembrane recepter protein
MNLKLSVGCSLRVVWVAMIVAAGTQAAAPQEVASSTDSIPEIVVTAEKRDTDLQKTPESISVINGARQQDRGETNLADLQLLVPNVTFSSTSNVSQIYIRGIGNTFINAGGDPGVAFYHDNAYVSDQNTTNTSMFDVDRVEVLRGPQGALYGRNAVGGAVNVISNKPTDDFQAQVSGLLGDFGKKESEGFVSGPIGLANTDMRVSYHVDYADGYTYNLLQGTQSNSRLDDLGSYAFRIQTLTHLPTDGTLGLIVNHYLESDNGAALAVKPEAGVIYPSEAIYGAVPDANPRDTYANVGRNHVNTTSVNLSLIQPLGVNTLSVLGNYRDSYRNFLNDCDGTSEVVCTYPAYTTSRDYYADIHIASPNANRFRWLFGATYLRFAQTQNLNVDFLSLAAYFVPGVPSNVPFPVSTSTGGNLVTKSYAGYADLRFQLSNIWAATGQLRYNETQKDAVQHAVIPAFGQDVEGYSGPGSYLDNISWPYKLALEGQLTPQLLVYASYTTAEKDGAINLGALQPTPVQPETVRSYEIGEKATFFDRRLLINSALFNSIYDDLQISQIVLTSVVLANAPKSKIQGAELEVVGLPMPGLQLSANLGYLDAKFTEFSNSSTLPGLVPGPVQNLSGYDLPNVSPVSVNLDAQYKFAVASGYSTSLDLQYSWRSRVYFNEFNVNENSQGPEGVFNFSTVFAPDNGPWKLYGYIHNVGNVTVATGATVYSGPLGAIKSISFAPPRQFGVGGIYSWR